MGETVRTASVLEIYNEAMKMLGDEKKSLTVKKAKLKSKSFFKNLLKYLSVLLAMLLLLFTSRYLFMYFDIAPISNILFVSAALIFYFKKPSLVEKAKLKSKSFLNNLLKNKFSGVAILIAIFFSSMAVLAYFNISPSYILFMGAALCLHFYRNFTNQHVEKIIEIDNRLIEIDSEIVDLRTKKDAMLKQSLSEADEFLSSKK
jgi:hypothetical protein